VPLIPSPRRELLAAGATRGELDRDLRSGKTVSLFRGVHAAAGAEAHFTVRVRAAAATQAPTARVAMQTSAALHKLRWLPEQWSTPDAVIHFAVEPAETRDSRADLKLHRRQLAPADCVLVDGIACLPVDRTLVELARDPKLPALLVVQIIDGALRDERTTKAELHACLARFPGLRGIARARGLVDRSREGVDSPQETRTRLMLEDAGITGLEVNIKIHDDDGFLLARGDLGIKRLLIWGEYDGFAPHTERATFRSDRAGDRWLKRRGWHVMRFTDEDLRRPARTCREWLAEIADAPARIQALDPRRSPEIAAARKGLGFD
jgi:hypothetical protein